MQGQSQGDDFRAALDALAANGSELEQLIREMSGGHQTAAAQVRATWPAWPTATLILTETTP